MRSHLFSVNYHVALRVCFCAKYQLRMANGGLIACENKYVFLADVVD